MADLRRLLSATRARIGDAAVSFAEWNSLPGERRDDDLFLVEFPKSGVTWLTFLMANVNALLAGERRDITFYNINDFIPDVHSVRFVSSASAALLGYRCFKSHSPYVRRYRKVIYLVRDPRHVMVSYWRFLKGLGWWSGSVEELVVHRKYGIGAWVDHVDGWLSGVDAAASFGLVRYEDFLADAGRELQRLYAMLGFALTDELIAAAVERSSLERMRQLEAGFAAGHPALKNLEFVRRGEVGGAREPLSVHAQELIERRAGNLMRMLGYGAQGMEPLNRERLATK
jgi:hypothetical protein